MNVSINECMITQYNLRLLLGVWRGHCQAPGPGLGDASDQ